MGCGCGGKQGTTTYQYEDAQGNVTVYRSQVEARAQQIRDGKTGTVTPVTK